MTNMNMIWMLTTPFIIFLIVQQMVRGETVDPMAWIFLLAGVLATWMYFKERKEKKIKSAQWYTIKKMIRWI